jgi:hypothetical protein
MNFGRGDLIHLRIHTLADFGSSPNDNITSITVGLELKMLSTAPSADGRILIHYIELYDIQAENRSRGMIYFQFMLNVVIPYQMFKR